MRAIFGRKMVNLHELKVLTLESIRKGSNGSEYVVTREVFLEKDKFVGFSNNFLEDQPCIVENDGGIDTEGRKRCIRVINKETNEIIIVNTEGYQYARYTALELKDL